MAIQVKTITLWRRDAENRPGSLADALAPLAGVGTDIQLLMGFRDPSVPGRAVFELYPVSGKKAEAAAVRAGLSRSSIPTLLVSGDNRPGLAHELSRTLADARINLAFLVAQVIGKRFCAVVGFEMEAQAKEAARLIQRPRKRRK
jgi:hypothetical protein